MPQMSPMNWMILMMLFLMAYFFIGSSLYYMKLYILKKENKTPFHLKKINWKNDK